MELRHLRYFVAIAEERSFTRAAERLWVAQPGLSTQMRRLEAELGVKLFERRTRGVDLTQAGELFLERARVAIAAADTAAATGRDLDAGVIGSVRLALASGARWHLTPDLLQRFSHERPGVELAVLEGDGGTLWRELREGRVDALLASAGHVSPDLRRLELGSEPWVALVGTGHPLAGIGPMAAEDLDGERIAVTGHRDGAAFARTVTNLLDELGVAAELVRGVPGPGLPAMIAGNDVVALTTAPDALPAGVLARPLVPRHTLSFELLWRDEPPSPALSEFVSVAASEAARPASRRPLAAVA
ncbi:MAG TPA: LysR family transcriptional regulator [Solirubrobacteraceae bacterium]|nr:LysR family transcriptional regulator [Solirubrobacteraceae bacterium]